MTKLQSIKETEQREFDEFIEKKSQELSECVDVMPEHVGLLKKRAYNIMLDLGYLSKNWLKEHDIRLEKAIREDERERVDEEWKLAIEKVDVYGEFKDKNQEELLKLVIQHTTDAILSEFARRRKNSNFISSLQEKQ